MRARAYDLLIFCQTVRDPSAEQLLAEATKLYPKVKSLAISDEGEQAQRVFFRYVYVQDEQSRRPAGRGGQPSAIRPYRRPLVDCNSLFDRTQIAPHRFDSRISRYNPLMAHRGEQRWVLESKMLGAQMDLCGADGGIAHRTLPGTERDRPASAPGGNLGSPAGHRQASSVGQMGHGSPPWKIQPARAKVIAEAVKAG